MSFPTQLFNLAARLPDATAITDAQGTRTFGAFIESVSRVSQTFSKVLHLDKGARVVLFMDNCAEFYEILFACWFAGLCPVPLNSKLHALEVANAINDSEAALCVVSGAKRQELETQAFRDGVSCKVATCDDIRTAAQDGTTLARPDPVSPTDAAWIFYTSGTTGKPKGALLTHRNLQSMCHAYYADIDRPGPGDTKLHAAPMSHASGLYGLAHLLRGGHQVILEKFDPGAVLRAIETYPNVTLFAAPTMLTRLMNCDAITSCDLTNLRLLYYGGGPMYRSELDRALRIFGPRLYHLYGQGEAPMTITGQHQRRAPEAGDAAQSARFASCGFARSGVDVRIFDETGTEVANGTVGEVVVRGDVVMCGYWRNPEATAKTIRDGWLYTGDLGALDDDGYLTLIDRSKDLIISGGSNIYPREIEEILLSQPEIAECAVIGVPDPAWGEAVRAFIVLRAGATFDRAKFDNALLGQLARFKRPKRYDVVEDLPKNNYGKVLKTDLRALAQGKA